MWIHKRRLSNDRRREIAVVDKNTHRDTLESIPGAYSRHKHQIHARSNTLEFSSCSGLLWYGTGNWVGHRKVMCTTPLDRKNLYLSLNTQCLYRTTGKTRTHVAIERSPYLFDHKWLETVDIERGTLAPIPGGAVSNTTSTVQPI